MILNNAIDIIEGDGEKETVNKIYNGDVIVWERKGIREVTGPPPLTIKTDGTNIIDWYVKGNVGGVGKLGKNYLKPRLEAIPNGSMGTLIGYSGWQSPDGYTFNTGEATKLSLLFKRNGDVALTPSDIGDIMLVEGSTIPSSYDASTTLFDAEITQGTTTRHDTPDITAESQGLFAGLDEYGRYNLYGQNADWLNKRCKSFLIDVKPNTDYSVRMFNNAYNDISIDVHLFKAPGTVTPAFVDCSAYTQKSIPDNGTFVRNEEQWVNLQYSQSRRLEYYYALPCDVRPIRYEFCNYYATLKAGTYKVMIDTWGNNRFWGSGGYWTGIQGYTGCVEDNFSYTDNQGNEWFALVEEDNTVIISKSDILPTITGDKMVKIDGTPPPLPNYFHNEITFTLDHDAKVGLIHKAYYESQATASPAYHRFMIVDSNVEAVYFETTGADPAQMQGYSAWEKYQVTLDIDIANKDHSQTRRISVDLNGEFLGPQDYATMTGIGVTLPTFEGKNIITVDSEIQPIEIYVKFNSG